MAVKKTELFSSFQSAADAIYKLTKAGWYINPSDHCTDLGFRFEVNMYHDGEPKEVDRAAILAKARAAKAAKNQQGGE